MSNFNILKSHHKERRLRQLNQTVCRRLHQDAGSMRHAVEAQLAERNVNVDSFVLSRLGDLLGKILEFSIQRSSASSLLLFGFKLLLIAVSVFALAITRFVKLNVGSLTVELDILGLLLSKNNGILEMNVDDDNELMGAWLEEEMLDVVEQDIDAMVCA